MSKIETIPLKRKMIKYLLIDPNELLQQKEEEEQEWRENAPIEEGWLLPQDFLGSSKNTSSLKHHLEPYSATELDRERKHLESLDIAEVKEVKGKPYTKKGKKIYPTKRAIRLKKDKKTFLSLMKSFYENNNLVGFMGSHYYLTNPYKLTLLLLYAQEWGLGSIERCHNPNWTKHYTTGEEMILAYPELFFYYLESPKEFKETKKEIVSAIGDEYRAYQILELNGLIRQKRYDELKKRYGFFSAELRAKGRMKNKKEDKVKARKK